MKASRLGTALLVSAATVTVLVASGALDVRITWRDNAARAIDLFGSKKEAAPDESTGERFWRENGLSEAIVPQGVPASFADLAQEASAGVVNIQTSRTVHGSAVPQFEDFFSGRPFEVLFRHRGPGSKREL